MDKTQTENFPQINAAYNRVFKPSRLSIGLVLPLEAYALGTEPTMRGHIEAAQRDERMGFSALWLRDGSFNVPSFGDAGQIFDPFVYLGALAAATDRIALGTASIILPLRHPARLAKSAAAADDGHHILLHGRSQAKLDAAAVEVDGTVETFCADLSDIEAVKTLAADIRAEHEKLDVLINNAGVLKTPQPVLQSGLDVRFVVNTLAPYLLTKLLLPIIPKNGRVVNLSSAAQAPVNVGAMLRNQCLSDMDAYAQSKLAITIWTRAMAKELPDGPAVIAVNPGSLLASKMVQEGFGIAGGDLSQGADILIEAALGTRFADSSGAYFDNDAGTFANPHSAALDAAHADEVMETIRAFARKYG